MNCGVAEQILVVALNGCSIVPVIASSCLRGG